MSKNIRALAASCCFAVVDQGRSLADELPRQCLLTDNNNHGLLQEMVYGVLRYLPELEHDIRHLLAKPLKGKQRVCHFLLLVGVYQIKYMRIPDHAAVAETVAATKTLKSPHLKGFVNAILRSYLRQEGKNINEPNDAVKYNHPSWFIQKIKAGYPDHWQSILTANQQRPPMWLRVNQQKTTVENYIKLLTDNNIAIAFHHKQTQALKLASAVDVNSLPFFAEGWVSIQDGAAQNAALLLGALENELILDCCAAPGGKTCHILELEPKVQELIAIDIEPERLKRVEENLSRLGLTATVIAGDAAMPDTWAEGKIFDRILLDAPCSGTGVIRRHPDIKWLRKASDIEVLVKLQSEILDAIWQKLKIGGTLIYATCSVLPEENCQQIAHFLARTKNAQLEHLPLQENKIGWQIIPDEQDMDGFYYAKIVKVAD